MKILNIPFSSPFLRTLSQIIAANNCSPRIVMPGKRAARELQNIYFNTYQTKLFAPVMTHTEIADNLLSFFESAKALPIIPYIADLELRQLLYSIIAKIPKAANIGIDKITKAIFEFYSYQYKLDDLRAGSVTEKMMCTILHELEQYLHLHKKLLEPQRQILAIKTLAELAKTHHVLPIYYILPTIESPHVAELLNFISQLDNGSKIITQGMYTKYDPPALDLMPSSSMSAVKDHTPKTSLDWDIEQIFHSAPTCLSSFTDMKIIKALSTTEEARTIAAETHRYLAGACNKIVGIITADRILARKLKAELRVLNIEVDDATDNFAMEQLPTQLFMMIAEYISHHSFDPVLFLEIAKHPCCTLYQDFKAITQFEIEILRNNNHYNISASYLLKLGENYPKIIALLSALEKNREIFKSTSKLLNRIKAHCNMYQEILSDQSLCNFSDLLQEQVQCIDLISSAYTHSCNYCDFILYAIQRAYYKKLTISGANIKILSPLEARFLKFDLCIMMGMEEGIFPPAFNDHRLFSNSLRKKYKWHYNRDSLTHNAALDLGNALSQSKLIISYSGKKPTRWLRVLEMHLEGQHADSVHYTTPPSAPLSIKKSARIHRSIGNPSIQHRPKSLTVSAIEMLMNDPYAYYARYILRLKRLNDIFDNVTAQSFGILLHEVLAQAVHLEISLGQDQYIEQFMEIYYRISIASIPNISLLNTLWEEKFKRIAIWLFYNESQNINDRKFVHTEIAICTHIGDLEIRARVDRLDIMDDGRVKIIDYKTGIIPSNMAVCKGLSPQLPLEGIILLNSNAASLGIDKIVKSDLEFYYIELHGRQNIGNNHAIYFDLELAHSSLLKLLTKYWKNGEPFVGSIRHIPMAADYKHLSRTQEWAAEEFNNAFHSTS